MKHALWLTLLLLAPAVAQAQDLAIRAGHVVKVAGEEPLTDATVLIRGGKVVAIGRDVEVPADMPLVARPAAWVVPGFVDPATALGLVGDTDELAAPMAPDVAPAINASHRDFAAARAAGITTVLIAPGDGNLVGGSCVLAKSTGARIETATPPLKLSLGPRVLRDDRPPTSRAGALDMLLRALEAAAGGEVDDPLGQMMRGERVGLFSVERPADLHDVAFGMQDQRVTLRFSNILAIEDLDRDPPLPLQAVVLGPYGLHTHPRVVRTASRIPLATTLAFCSGAPASATGSQRLTAVLCARYGLPPARALEGLTSGPAAAIGLEERVGTLEVGKDGDVVVLDGPPLRLASRVLATYVEGKRVYVRPGRADAEGTP